MEGQEHAVAVLRWKLIARIEEDVEYRNVGAEQHVRIERALDLA